MTVRKFKLEDYNGVVALWKESGLIFRPGDDLEGIKLMLQRDQELFVVAEADGKIIGAVLGGWDGRRGWIYHLAVKPDCRRRGIASSLVRELETRLVEKGARKINAQIYQWNEASLQFFKSIGYEVHQDLLMIGKTFQHK